jgi:DNA-binding response OmpR family regulator
MDQDTVEGGKAMPNVLLIHDGTNAELTVQQVLSGSGTPCACLALEEFQPEILLSEMFDLIIFELFGESRSCIVILQQLERWFATSGIEHPPVIFVTQESSDTLEQAVRTAKVNFYLVKPIAEAQLASVIGQSLRCAHRPVSACVFENNGMDMGNT